jgi:Zn finger protein HypA/HybF involved in hydrogenase expression
MAAKISQTIEKIKRLFPIRDKSLAISHPLIAKEWHPTFNKDYQPSQFSHGSNVSCWWQCAESPEHVWQARIYNRTLQGSGCPNCNLGVATDLRDYPKVLKTFMKDKNRGVDPYRLPWHTKVWWKCGKAHDHIWKSTFNRRPGERCPFCRGKKPSSTNNLSLVQPIAKQWHPTKNGKMHPQQFCQGSSKRVWWRCKKGADHEWEARIMTRTRGEGGCPFCLNQKVSVTNSLARAFPKVVEQWHPTRNGKLKPKDVTAASTSKVWWKCEKGPDHEWQALVLSRTTLETGCPFCVNKRLSVTNCLTTLNPKAAKDWHPTKNGKLRPEHVIALTFKKAWFKCSTCDHEWRTSPQLRTARGYGCPSCRYEKVRTVRKEEIAENRVDKKVTKTAAKTAAKTTAKTTTKVAAKVAAKKPPVKKSSTKKPAAKKSVK